MKTGFNKNRIIPCYQYEMKTNKRLHDDKLLKSISVSKLRAYFEILYNIFAMPELWIITEGIMYSIQLEKGHVTDLHLMSLQVCIVVNT